MGKIKGKLSVQKAVGDLYPELPQRFSMISFHAMVAREICRPQVYMDTVRRKLDLLRETGAINFECIDRERSIYHKLESL